MGKTLLWKTLEVLVGNTISRALLLVFQVAFTALLGADQFGNWSILFSVLLYASLLAPCGVDFGVIRYLAIFQSEQDDQRIRSLVRGALVVAAVGGIGLGALLIGGASVLAHSVYHKPELALPLMLLGLVVPAESMNVAIGAILQGLRRFRASIVVGMLARNLFLLTVTPLFFLGTIEFYHTVYFLLAGSLAGSLIGLWQLWKLGLLEFRRGSEDWSILRQVMAEAVPLLLCNSINRVVPLAICLAGIFLNSADVGVFALMLNLLVVLAFPQRAVNVTAPVEFARLYHLNMHAQLSALFQTVSRGMMIASSLAAIPTAVASLYVFALLDPNLHQQSLFFLPLLGLQLVNAGTGPVGQLLIYTRGKWAFLWISVIVVILQVAAFLILTPWLGLSGAVLAHCLTVGTFIVLRHWASWRTVGIHSLNAEIVSMLLAAGGCVAVGLFIATLDETRACQVAGTVAALLCYGLFLLVYVRKPWMRSKMAPAYLSQVK